MSKQAGATIAGGGSRLGAGAAMNGNAPDAEGQRGVVPLTFAAGRDLASLPDEVRAALGAAVPFPPR